jgi:hypothetical protein
VKALAPKIEFIEPFQSDLPCPVRVEKISRFPCRANHLYKLARPGSPTRGVSRSSRTWSCGCGGRFWRDKTSAFEADGEVVWSWHLDADAKLALIASAIALMTETIKPDLRGGTKETVKTIARGMPGDSGVTVVTTLVCFFILHTRLRARSAPGIPCAL